MTHSGYVSIHVDPIIRAVQDVLSSPRPLEYLFKTPIGRYFLLTPLGQRVSTYFLGRDPYDYEDFGLPSRRQLEPAIRVAEHVPAGCIDVKSRFGDTYLDLLADIVENPNNYPYPSTVPELRSNAYFKAIRRIEKHLGRLRADKICEAQIDHAVYAEDARLRRQNLNVFGSLAFATILYSSISGCFSSSPTLEKDLDCGDFSCHYEWPLGEKDVTVFVYPQNAAKVGDPLATISFDGVDFRVDLNSGSYLVAERTQDRVKNPDFNSRITDGTRTSSTVGRMWMRWNSGR